MHAKKKGNIGESAVILDLIRQGYDVFTEFGDNSKVDLIALDDDGIPFKIQVKYIEPKNGKIVIHAKKSGPNYKYKYTTKDVDWFAVYIPGPNICVYIPAQKVCKGSFTIRYEERLRNMGDKVNWAEDYRKLGPRAES